MFRLMGAPGSNEFVGLCAEIYCKMCLLGRNGKCR